MFLLITTQRMTFGPPIACIPAALSPGAMRTKHKANHSPPSSAEVKIHGTLPQRSDTPPWHSA